MVTSLRAGKNHGSGFISDTHAVNAKINELEKVFLCADTCRAFDLDSAAGMFNEINNQQSPGAMRPRDWDCLYRNR